MRIAISGATGLIGTALFHVLHQEGHELIVLTRNSEKAKQKLQAQTITWQSESIPPSQSLEHLHAVVNLAGESIAGERWSVKKKKAISDSRVIGTKNLVKALSRCENRPKVLINASAVGYYGNRQEKCLDEDSPPGKGFLAEVCQQWEKEALRARDLGIRVVLLRGGLALSSSGGALPRMLLPFKLFAGGPLGRGDQQISWIHLKDEVEIIHFAMETDSIEGPLNATAPYPVSQREFAQTLGKVLGCPAFLPTPAFALRFMMGEMAQALLLEGQRVLPRKLMQAGFRFRFPTLSEALGEILSQQEL